MGPGTIVLMDSLRWVASGVIPTPQATIRIAHLYQEAHLHYFKVRT